MVVLLHLWRILIVSQCYSDPSFEKPININFTYGDENEVYSNTNIIKPLPSIKFNPNENQTISVDITGEKVGHLVIGAESSDIKM